MLHATIDHGDASAPTSEQHDLATRLTQLEAIAQRGGFADDHVINVLLERYAQARANSLRAFIP